MKEEGIRKKKKKKLQKYRNPERGGCYSLQIKKIKRRKYRNEPYTLRVMI